MNQTKRTIMNLGLRNYNKIKVKTCERDQSFGEFISDLVDELQVKDMDEFSYREEPVRRVELFMRPDSYDTLKGYSKEYGMSMRKILDYCLENI